MPSEISNLLYGEHAYILDGIQLVLALDRKWEKDADEYEKSLEELLAFFTSYADKYHHFKEEVILFPELQQIGNASVNAIIEELLEQHDDFREVVKEIKKCVAEKNYALAQQKVKKYMKDLQDHIAAENDELFPMADSLLPENELERMYFRCIDKDFELGDQQKIAFEAMIEKIVVNKGK